MISIKLSRVLAACGLAIFTEPLRHNRLINCCRTSTLALRIIDNHRLLRWDVDTARAILSSVRLRHFHLIMRACVPLRNLAAFRLILRCIDALTEPSSAPFLPLGMTVVLGFNR